MVRLYPSRLKKKVNEVISIDPYDDPYFLTLRMRTF